MQAFALPARIHIILDYLPPPPPPPSIYRVPEENLNHEILRVLSLAKKGGAAAAASRCRAVSPRRVSVRGCSKRKGRERKGRGGWEGGGGE